MLPWKDKQPRYGPEWEIEKPEQHLRIVLANLQRLPTIAKADRSTQFLEHLKLRNPDVTLANDVSIDTVPAQTGQTNGMICGQFFVFASYTFTL